MVVDPTTVRESSALPAQLEVALSGGRMSTGVVRVGDTVRRPASESSSYVASLLNLLEHRGFPGAPRYLGQDEHGRDVVTYIAGRVPARLERWTDAQVGWAGRLLRRFHDATRGTHAAGSAPAVCHHDAGPYNFVFRRGRPIAMIDFDMAAPGDPLEDLGYMAWLWCISSKRTAPPIEGQARQVRALVDGYGLADEHRPAVVDATFARQAGNAAFWRERLDDPEFRLATRAEILERIRWSLREALFTSARREVFAAALA